MCGAGGPASLSGCQSQPIRVVQRDGSHSGREVEVIVHGFL
jgi:hypothetical protein